MPIIPLDAQGLLDADVPCVVCGYNLRSLTLAATCPECGSPVDGSARGDLLQFADQAWLARVTRGLTMLLLLVLAGIVLGMVVGVVAAVLTAGNPGNPPNPRLAITAQAILVIGLGVFSVIAWLGFTSPEPDPFVPEASFSPRAITRATVVIGFFLGLANQVALWIDPANIQSAPAQWGSLLSQLVALAQMVAALLYARSLALRIPNLSLARQARRLARYMGLSLAAAFLAGLVLVLTTGSVSPVIPVGPTTAPSAPPTSAVVLTAGVVTMLMGLAMLVLGIWALIFANRLRMALRDVRQKTAATP
ncbi:MAG: hypothetical protein IT441_10735 [Phycisphaeraceae bacterium]|nr:hypothetical protein [Phycisphaeraceae bacterium]